MRSMLVLEGHQPKFQTFMSRTTPLGVLALCLASAAASAGTYSNNFSSSTPTGYTLTASGQRPAPNEALPYPVVEDGVLKLTYAENSEQGTVIFDDLDPGVAIGSFTANFKVRIGGGSSSPADGMSFFYGTGIDASANFGEEGPAQTDPPSVKGITVSIDTYDNVDTDPANGVGEAPAIDVMVDGVQVLHKMVDVFFLQSDTPVPVTIQLKPNGTISVNYRGTDIYKDEYLPGWAPLTGGLFAIAGRTGGANENNWIDDVQFTTVAAPAATGPSITTGPQSAAVNEHGSATFTVAFAGTPSFTFQWSSNGTDVPGATNSVYSLSNIPASLNGALIRVKITNAQGSVTSDPATLTVNADTSVPTITAAAGTEALNSITLTFSEAVTSASASALANYAVNNGLVINSVTVLSPTSVRLSTSAQTAGTVYTVTVNNIEDTATTPNPIAANSTIQFTAFARAAGFLKFEYWGGIASARVVDLTDNARYQAGTPDRVYYLSAFDSRTVFPDDSHETYGARASGWLTPTQSGNYYLFLRSDDASELWFSSDETQAGLSKVAEETGCCGAFMEPGDVRTAGPFALVAGHSYPIMALLQENTGGDYLQVAWRLDTDTTAAGSLTPIPGAYLSTMVDPGVATITFTTQPANASTTENKTATFTVAATGSPTPLTIQWQRAEAGSSTFVNISGATANSYTTPLLKKASDNGAKYRVVATVPGKVLASAEATLTVDIDSTPPTLVSVGTGDGYKTLVLTFSEPMDAASASVASHYVITPSLAVTAATLVNSTTVRLTTATQAQNTSYTVTVSAVLDTAIPGNVIDPAHNSGAATSWISAVGAIKWEIYTGIGGTAVSALTSAAKYPGSPDEVRMTAGLDTTQIGGHYSGYADNYGGRLSGYVIPKVSGDYNFFIKSDDASQLFISTDDDPAHLSANPIAEEKGCCHAFVEPGAGDPDANGSKLTSDAITLVAGQRYFILALYKEGGGGDFIQVAMRKSDDATAADQLKPLRGSLVAADVSSATLAKVTLPIGLASPLGSGDANKPGFNARVYQVSQQGATALYNSEDRAEQELAGIIGPNVADLSAAVNGVFQISGTINWNQEMGAGGTGAEIGTFQSGSTPARADTAIPGIPGTGTAAYNTDNIAGEVVTYAEFPTAGIYTLGVSSDDGFRVTGTDQAPAHNGALVVEGSSAAAGAYYAANGSVEVGGVFKPFHTQIRGKLVYSNPAAACDPILNAAEMAGNIALIDRGVCTFSSKAQKALDAGAIAVVIINSRDPGSADGPWPIVMGGSYVDVPAVMISKPDGVKIKDAIAGGATLTVSLTPVQIGSDALGDFDLGRGATDSMFVVNVPQAGVYPLRLVWFEGGGGANLEWFSLDADGASVLLNDTAASSTAIKTFRARTAVLPTPTVAITRLENGNLQITFVGTLQASDTVNGTYSDVSAASPLVLSSPAGQAKFYRARQ